MKKPFVLGVSLALVLPLVVAAATHRKPGLWQITSNFTFTKGGPQIPPDQLAKMQQMGIKMPGMGSPITIQQCLTPERAAQDDHPDMASKDCQFQNASWSGNNFSADIACQGRMGDTHGHVQFTGNGDTSYSGTAHMEGSNPQMGGDYAADNQITGQWQSSDCGSVKPYTPQQH